MKADVAIVGGGLVGLAIARRIGLDGGDAIVIDRQELGMGASWAAAGMLAPQSESEEPGSFFSLLLKAREFYPLIVSALQAETGIDVGYRSEGMIIAAFDDGEESELERIADWQSVAGLAVERLTGDEARILEPALSSNVVGAIRLPEDHQVDNRLLTDAYRTSAANAGVKFRIGSGVRSVAESSTGGAVVIETEGGTRIEAERVVIAAGSWSGLIGGLPSALPVEPIHGQLLAIQMAAPPIRHLVSGAGGYLVPRSDGRLIVGATMDRFGFRTAVTPAGLRTLTTSVLRLVPGLAHRPVVAHWSGLRPGTPDGLPILGADPVMPRVIYATGHFRNGVLLAPLTGEIIGRMALGGTTGEDLDPYRVERFRTAPVSIPAYPPDTTSERRAPRAR